MIDLKFQFRSVTLQVQQVLQYRIHYTLRYTYTINIRNQNPKHACLAALDFQFFNFHNRIQPISSDSSCFSCISIVSLSERLTPSLYTFVFSCFRTFRRCWLIHIFWLGRYRPVRRKYPVERRHYLAVTVIMRRPVLPGFLAG